MKTPYAPDPALTGAENAEREWCHIRRHAAPADFYAAMNRVASLPDDAGEYDRTKATSGRNPYDPRFSAEAHVAAYRQVLADREAGVPPTLCTPGAMCLQWDDERHSYRESITRSVDLTGAPPITVTAAKGSKVHAGLYSPYAIRFEYTRHQSATPWRSEITIYALRHGDLVGSSFSPDRVADMPQWLTDLIEQAAPKETP